MYANFCILYSTPHKTDWVNRKSLSFAAELKLRINLSLFTKNSAFFFLSKKLTAIFLF